MTFLSMTHGDTVPIQTTITNLPAGGLTGCSFWFTAKYFPTDADSAAAIQKLPGNFSVLTVGSNTVPGVVQVILGPSDTASLPYYTLMLTWDIQMKDSLGNIYTVDSGALRISPDMTRTTT